MGNRELMVRLLVLVLLTVALILVSLALMMYNVEGDGPKGVGFAGSEKGRANGPKGRGGCPPGYGPSKSRNPDGDRCGKTFDLRDPFDASMADEGRDWRKEPYLHFCGGWLANVRGTRIRDVSSWEVRARNEGYFGGVHEAEDKVVGAQSPTGKLRFICTTSGVTRGDREEDKEMLDEVERLARAAWEHRNDPSSGRIWGHSARAWMSLGLISGLGLQGPLSARVTTDPTRGRGSNVLYLELSADWWSGRARAAATLRQAKRTLGISQIDVEATVASLERVRDKVADLGRRGAVEANRRMYHMEESTVLGDGPEVDLASYVRSKGFGIDTVDLGVLDEVGGDGVHAQTLVPAIEGMWMGSGSARRRRGPKVWMVGNAKVLGPSVVEFSRLDPGVWMDAMRYFLVVGMASRMPPDSSRSRGSMWHASDDPYNLRSTVGSLLWTPVMHHGFSDPGVPPYRSGSSPWNPSRALSGGTPRRSVKGVCDRLVEDWMHDEIEKQAYRYQVGNEAVEMALDLALQVRGEIEALVSESKGLDSRDKEFLLGKVRSIRLEAGRSYVDSAASGDSRQVRAKTPEACKPKDILSGRPLWANLLHLGSSRAACALGHLYSDQPPPPLMGGEGFMVDNAVYRPEVNTITIFPGILSVPYFYDEWPKDAVYARLAFVIAHEMGHALGDSSMSFGPLGEVRMEREVLAPGSVASLLKRAECFVELYRGVTPNGNEVDPKRTRDENVSDMIGLEIAYRLAVKADKGRRDRAVVMRSVVGYYSQLLCQNLTPRDELELVENDVHSLFFQRVDVVSKALISKHSFNQSSCELI